jgi:hypothetical protein
MAMFLRLLNLTKPAACIKILMKYVIARGKGLEGSKTILKHVSDQGDMVKPLDLRQIQLLAVALT